MASQNFEPFNFTDLKDKIDGKIPLLGALILLFLFFFTFLFVYFLYTCTHRRGGNSNAPPSRNSGLDAATISGLPIFPYGSIDEKPSLGAECAICLSVFQEGDKVKVLPICRHGFHPSCVDVWLMARSSCPLCRACVHQAGSLSCEPDSEIP